MYIKGAKPMSQPPSATPIATSHAQAAKLPAVDTIGITAIRSGALHWLGLSAQRSEELAAELGQFAAVSAAVSAHLRFDSEPADWYVSCARWQQEAR